MNFSTLAIPCGGRRGVQLSGDLEAKIRAAMQTGGIQYVEVTPHERQSLLESGQGRACEVTMDKEHLQKVETDAEWQEKVAAAHAAAHADSARQRKEQADKQAQELLAAEMAKLGKDAAKRQKKAQKKRTKREQKKQLHLALEVPQEHTEDAADEAPNSGAGPSMQTKNLAFVRKAVGGTRAGPGGAAAD